MPRTMAAKNQDGVVHVWISDLYVGITDFDKISLLSFNKITVSS
ncbi:hypothetical protein MtrunA17_Chr6g0452751 [Medicago truncatula]|uniref:Uncharacterized protein n=1 Tax=Medicago truncatula TaxID=3880 RepID=A0A396HDW7_MEDTR|nr:hypothetical protein MtrunA17_Chr6g0452751 [Medicago truncatula]